MRFPHSGYVTDKYGTVIPDATVNVYLAGTLTPATIYTTPTIVASVNSVTSDSLGRFEFYVDNDDYSTSQYFKIVAYTIYDTLTYDNISIILNSYDLVTSIGNPGSDLNIPSEKAVRDALNVSPDAHYVYVDSYASLTAAISDIGSTPTNLICDNSTTITANTVIPSTVNFIVLKNGLITQTGAYTLTINGPFSCTGQCFSGTAAGDVIFGAGSTTVIHPRWFATNTTPGTTDMTTAIIAAIAASPTSGTVILPPGKSLISSQIVIDKKMTFKGYGEDRAETTGYYPSSTIIKKSSMTTTAIVVSGFGVSLKSFALEGETGNTGDGIQITGNNDSLEDITVSKMGGVGIHVGDSAAGGIGGKNSNSFNLYKVTANNNTSHGIYIDSNHAGTPDANAGLVLRCSASNNGGDGIRDDNGWVNTFTANVTENNSGYGMYFTSLSKDNSVFGGDHEEINTGGGIYNAGVGNMFFTPYVYAMTDIGTYTVIVSREKTNLIGNFTVTTLPVQHGGIQQLGNNVFLERHYNNAAVPVNTDIPLFYCTLPGTSSSWLFGTLYVSYNHATGGDGTRYVFKAYAISVATSVSGAVSNVTEIPEYSFTGASYTSNATTATWTSGTLVISNLNTMTDASGLLMSWSFVGHHIGASDFTLY